jgi:hypothetical protein
MSGTGHRGVVCLLRSRPVRSVAPWLLPSHFALVTSSPPSPVPPSRVWPWFSLGLAHGAPRFTTAHYSLPPVPVRRKLHPTLEHTQSLKLRALKSHCTELLTRMHPTFLPTRMLVRTSGSQRLCACSRVRRTRPRRSLGQAACQKPASADAWVVECV